MKCKYVKTCKHYKKDSILCNKDAGIYSAKLMCNYFIKNKEKRK